MKPRWRNGNLMMEVREEMDGDGGSDFFERWKRTRRGWKGRERIFAETNGTRLLSCLIVGCQDYPHYMVCDYGPVITPKFDWILPSHPPRIKSFPERMGTFLQELVPEKCLRADSHFGDLFFVYIKGISSSVGDELDIRVSRRLVQTKLSLLSKFFYHQSTSCSTIVSKVHKTLVPDS